MEEKNNKIVRIEIIIVICTAMIIAVVFCNKKNGLHFDEYYSYYSTNATAGLNVNDGQWKNTYDIRTEFVAMPGESLNFSGVKLKQSTDVHPPFYYYILRTVCWLTKDIFTMWQGLIINLGFYFVCLILLIKISDLVGGVINILPFSHCYYSRFLPVF